MTSSAFSIAVTIHYILQAEPASTSTPTDAPPKKGGPSAAKTPLELSVGDGDEQPKPVKKKPALSSQKRPAKKTGDDEEISEKLSEKEGGGEGGGGDDSTLLDFSFGDDVAEKPHKKRPVLSSTKNPPKRRSKKPGEEDGGEGEGEGEENAKPAQKVCNTTVPWRVILGGATVENRTAQIVCTFRK